MKPRTPTEQDCEYWRLNGHEATIGPMQGSHIGAGDLQVIHNAGYVRVPWVSDDRDSLQTVEGETVWTSFRGGMLATDVIVTSS